MTAGNLPLHTVPLHRICITPVRNEAWIIERFLAAARTWATTVVIADQGSSDGTARP